VFMILILFLCGAVPSISPRKIEVFLTNYIITTNALYMTQQHARIYGRTPSNDRSIYCIILNIVLRT
jgi:hypothetical protein